jgi:hypothetical protein
LQEFELLSDVYFKREYIELYLRKDEAIFEYTFDDNGNHLSNLSIKRPIRIGDSASNTFDYYDLETAYGYGGFVTNSDDPDFIKKAFDEYKNYCSSHRIVAEFVRFHPFINSISKYETHFDNLKFNRETVAIDLKLNQNARRESYPESLRNSIRKNQKRLEFSETQNLERFQQLYAETMARNSARSFYRFDVDYFRNLKNLDNTRIFQVNYDEQTIAMATVLIGENIAHYHLSCTDKFFFKLKANDFLIDSICDHLKSFYENVEFLHLGGGRTSDANDSLLAYKSKFSSFRRDFYVGGIVFNQNIYNELCNSFDTAHPEKRHSVHFLKYRSEENE